MEHFGIVSIIPPLLAIFLAIVSKRVIMSLFLGVVVGLAIYTGSAGGTLVELGEVLTANLADDWNARVLIFTCLLGSMVGLMYASGGSQAFGNWAQNKIKSRKGAQLSTWFLGLIIMFDDYFNTLTVGSVMRNITDKFKVSREKLAYIVDSTAAPVAILTPISSWIAYAMSLYAAEYERLGEEIAEFDIFISAIPFNFYALLAVIMVFVLAVTNLEFGPMAKAEKRAIDKGELYKEESKDEIPGQDITELSISDKGKVSDLLLPIIMLIGVTIISMLYTGGYWDNGMSFRQAIGDSDVATALLYATLIGNFVAIIWYVTRRVLSLKDSMEAVVQGIKAMVPALAILLLAWSIGDVAGMLGTGEYVAGIVGAHLPLWSIPAVVFLVSAVTAFSTGTSWGTFAIMFPIAIPLAVNLGISGPMLIASVLGGSIFGDHCSPISDTTILSSTGAACNHIDHVNTQLPYAVLLAIISAIGYVLSAIMNSAFIPLGICIVILVAVLYFLHARGERVEASRMNQ